jgi:hypothetical protein
MRIDSLIVLLVSLLVSGAALPAQDEGVTLGHSDWSGTRLHFAARFEPPDAGAAKKIDSAVVTGQQDRQHRLILDRSQKRYFGYDLKMEPRGSGTFQLRIEPLNLTAKQLEEIGADSSWTRLGLPKYPLIPEVRVGDSVTIDLLVNPASGQKIVDYISLRRAIDQSVPSDFSLTDAVLEMDSPKVMVNGKPVDGSPFGGDLIGSVLWFYLAGHGEFVISMFPNPKLGFQKAGQVAGKTLTFSDGGVVYRLESNTRIAPGLGIYNVYVRHKAASRPGETFILGSADRPEFVVHE